MFRRRRGCVTITGVCVFDSGSRRSSRTTNTLLLMLLQILVGYRASQLVESTIPKPPDAVSVPLLAESAAAMHRGRAAVPASRGRTVQPPPPSPRPVVAFTKDFTRPMSIPEEGIEAAVTVLRSGRLFRYSCTSAERSQVAQAEREFAQAAGARYALGVNSCSSAILIALLSVGVRPGDEVLTNAFTFTAVPSTVLRLGANPVLVECSDSWTMDLDDLESKAKNSGAKVLLLSHMRGKVCDMDRVAEICDRHGLTLVEDCAHACGVTWRGRQLGYHAKVAAYSTQSDKVINSGEGGFVVTSDDAIAAKAIYLSGAYERRYDKHLVRPSDALCEEAMLTVPNLSLRMSEITAAVTRPLLRSLPERVIEYNRRYQMVVDTMSAEAPGLIEVPDQDERAGTVGDHLNFRLVGPTQDENLAFQAKCKELGVPVSWLRSPVNARWHVNWRGFGGPVQDLPATDRALAAAYDLKLPPHFLDEDFVHLARNIAHAAVVTVGRRHGLSGQEADVGESCKR